MSKVTLTNLEDIYDAWRDHDLDRFASHLPADFSHSLNIPPELLGVGGMREPVHMAPDETKVVVEVHTRCQHRLSGQLLDTKKKHVWLLEDGWPVRLSEYYDLDQFRAFMKSMR